MKKKILSIVLALVMVLSIIQVAGLPVFAEGTHTHTFSNEWTINTTGHWHECTAEGCDIKDYATCDLKVLLTVCIAVLQMTIPAISAAQYFTDLMM